MGTASPSGRWLVLQFGSRSETGKRIYSEPASAPETDTLESEDKAQDGREDVNDYRMMHVR